MHELIKELQFDNYLLEDNSFLQCMHRHLINCAFESTQVIIGETFLKVHMQCQQGIAE